MEICFETATDADVERTKARGGREALADYEEQLKDWAFDVAEWKRLGGADVNFLRTFEQGRRMMYLFCREACGTGGYLAESGHYFNDGIDGPDRYVTSFFDIEAYIPRIIFSTVYFANGSSRHLGINSSAGANGARIAALFPVIPDRLKPVVLWHWNRETGGSVERPDPARIAKENPVYSLLYYPLDMKPEEPKTAMPLAWEVPSWGYYAFRNGWEGGEDILFEFLGRTKGNHGWGGPDGGAFRLQGLGHVWASGNTGREVRRWVESVVNLTENPELPFGSRGRIVHSRAEKDGSGAVSYDYTASCYARDQKDAPWEERYGGIIHPGTAEPICRALRAVAIDFSGMSGAKALFAMVDRIEGGKEKEWLWQVPDLNACKADEKGFTITNGDASLRVTFIAPARPKVEVVKEARQTTKSAGHGAGSAISIDIRAVIAQSMDDPSDGRFFVVATLQRGAAPSARAEGSGLDARVTVGRSLVRFDGEKIIISPVR
jgi:hypothetical protein